MKYILLALILVSNWAYSKIIIVDLPDKEIHITKSSIEASYNTTPILSSPNRSICGSLTSATINSSVTDPSLVYTWSKRNTSTGVYETISGATGSSLTVTSAGDYRLSVLNSSTNTTWTSNPYTIYSGSTATLTNTNGDTSPITIASGQTGNLTVNFSGLGPWNYTLNDGVNRFSRTSQNSQITVPVTPETSLRYFLNSISGSGSCSSGTPIGGVIVNVSPTPIFTYDTPTMTTVCPGGIITIPHTFTNAGTNRRFYVGLLSSTGSSVSSSTINDLSSNPIYYQVPSSISTGTYRFSTGSQVPYINSPAVSPYTFEVVSSNCPALPQASIQSLESACSSIFMRAVPSGSGYTYQWYKDNVLISGATLSSYTASSSGNYTVQVINISTSYNSTSINKNINLTLETPILTSPNRSICGSLTSATINSSITNPSFTYVWSKLNTNNNQYEIISGQTNPSITVISAGDYQLSISNGYCNPVSSIYRI
ncbi:MAG: hypothetical protein ACRCVT_12715 [Leadbetterella sp.]